MFDFYTGLPHIYINNFYKLPHVRTCTFLRWALEDALCGSASPAVQTSRSTQVGAVCNSLKYGCVCTVYQSVVMLQLFLTLLLLLLLDPALTLVQDSDIANITLALQTLGSFNFGGESTCVPYLHAPPQEGLPAQGTACVAL